MFRPDVVFAPAVPGTVADSPAPAAPARASAAGFGSLYASLDRDIRGTIRNGFERTTELQLSSQAVAWANAMRARAEAGRDAGHRIPDGPGAAIAHSDGPEQQAFLAEIMPHARRAGAMIGTAPELIAAHAALESGWGTRPLKNARGETTHNLFGIKSAGGWQGESAAAATTEYVNGAPVKMVDHFRAYRGYAGAFLDYATLLRDSPRYAGALNTGDDAHAFASALKRGGYATDPAYVSKFVTMARQVKGMVR
ncbi:glucosaminidase domain-containing protein [Burkholderia sp. BCC0044]|uniref:glucosaminidase domain-containing protein n=1 Tax=Burkholderia sp. BCC0044 TaxID=2676295 RepID=UPI00158BF780|nr:glucosaminidase domain-containing protein [Burkholderia sp. BCC0044]